MADRVERLGISPTYISYRGGIVRPPQSTIDAIVKAMEGDRPRRITTPRGEGGPQRCSPPPRRAWGWAVQVYAVRSKDSWGIGDFADLRDLGRWASKAGASVILISPLGAQPPTSRQEPCPYYASSRRFLNLLYLRIEDIPGAERCADELRPLRDEALALNAQRHIDHDAAFRIKSEALEIVHRAEPDPPGMAKWIDSQGTALRDFAKFEAQQAGAVDAPHIAFREWIQFHLHQQLARAAAEISLIADVPVGFSSGGFDAWRWRELIAPGARVGAPPDFFFPDGQDWGMPPFDPWKLADAGFEPFRDAIGAVAAHAGGLRLDHVMSLFRLFWIPTAATATDGAYVRYPTAPLFKILAEVSAKTDTFVIGEDLGLVEPAVRSAMRRRRALGYRLLLFEEGPAEQGPRVSGDAIVSQVRTSVACMWNLCEHDLRHPLL
jgi:4-alpha-glucanotransferase